MKPVTVSTPSLSTIAGQHATAAETVGERAAAERFDAALLAPAFGLIGAPFLSALAASMAARAARLDGLTAAHRGQTTATAAAATAYGAAEAANAAEVSA
ncbi:type VII secretion target [Gordonia hirsuta]|nr:type VII secretion target [Gordonia hirsuta]